MNGMNASGKWMRETLLGTKMSLQLFLFHFRTPGGFWMSNAGKTMIMPCKKHDKQKQWRTSGSDRMEDADRRAGRQEGRRWTMPNGINTRQITALSHDLETQRSRKPGKNNNGPPWENRKSEFYRFWSQIRKKRQISEFIFLKERAHSELVALQPARNSIGVYHFGNSRKFCSNFEENVEIPNACYLAFTKISKVYQQRSKQNYWTN